MTKEQAIKHLKLMQSGARNAIRFSKNDKKISEEERKEDIEIYQDQLETLDMAIKALEQQPNDCTIFGTKENCFGGATENECEHCDYKQVLEQQSYEDEVQKVVDYLLTPTSKPTSKNCVVEDLLKEVSEQKRWLSDAGYNVYNVDVAFESITRAIQNIKKKGNENESVN